MPAFVRTSLVLLVVGLLLTLTCCGGERQEPAPQPGAIANWQQPVDPKLEEILKRYDGLEPSATNVLLISMDSVRRDFMSCYGYVPQFAPDEKTSPNVDRLAAEGVLFENYLSNTSWTLPSHMSMMTGEPDLVHRVENDAFALDPSRPTIAAMLQRLGHTTAGFYTGPYCHENYGFGRGMDRYEDAYTGALDEAANKRYQLQDEFDRVVLQEGSRGADALLAEIQALDRQIDTLSHEDINSKVVCDKSLEFINAAEAAGKPWFVFAHFFDPHYDYIPPKEWETRFDPAYKGGIDGRHFFENQRIGVITKDPRVTLRSQVCSDRDLDHIRALYAAEIAYTDHEIGKMLDALRASGVLDKTLVIVTSDHGEEFFEHGGIGHRSTLFEEQLRVPMVMRFPKGEFAGTRVQGLTSHCDILPTIADALGVPPPGRLNGKSALPLIEGTSDGSDRFVVGRLIRKASLAQVSGLPIDRYTIKEVFYTGDIKVYRWRRWWWPRPDCPAGRAERCRENAAKYRAQDWLLRWIDVNSGPGETGPDFPLEFDKPFVADFGDPRAAAALEQFKSVYADMLSQSRPVGPSIGGKTFWAMWRRPDKYTTPIEKELEENTLPPPGT